MSFVIEDVLAIHGVKLKFPVKENVYVDLYVDIVLNRDSYIYVNIEIKKRLFLLNVYYYYYY